MTEHESDTLRPPTSSEGSVAAEQRGQPAAQQGADDDSAAVGAAAASTAQPGSSPEARQKSASGSTHTRSAKGASKGPVASAKTLPSKPVRRFIWLLVVLLGAAALVAAGYSVWQVNQSALAAFALQQQSLETRLEDSQRQIAQLQVVSQDSSAGWQRAVAKLETLVIDSAQRLNRVANRNENRWPLEEALTLTRLAQQRLQLDASALVAKGLLRSADQILSTLDQAAVLPLRRQLAIDLLALESAPSADVNGLYFALDALAGQIQELSWLPKPSLATALPSNDTPLTGFWHSLKQIVVIQRLDVAMQAPPLMDDFERWRQHQLLLIEQSQLALLARNQTLYDAALSQTRVAMAQMASQFPTELWQQQLAEMQVAVLNPQWPDLQGSRAAIEIYLSEQTEPVEEVTP
ncbi:uroporphyrinogen-III C-methyltransferase [Reinekea sp.]|jgi:uroporphyrin-3 C-methyltransferase|uniref:uroporphyrinogen-III C-methyltransferase n=1 Tax=Reinekea sp. TaxID=1970455 RepID=UPI002A83F920|nr:uroporphyrinogen-III C-methyltransferase [Reinekea sp.]